MKYVISCYLICVIVFLSNIFVYPGFLNNHLKFNPANFFVIFLVVGGYQFLLAPINHKRVAKAFFAINRIVVLPVSFVTSLLFTILEASHYPNYVFAAIGIHYYDFLYIFFIAYLTELIYLGRDSFFYHFQKHLLVFAGVLIYMFVVITFWANGFDRDLSREGGFLENSQFFLYLISGFFTLYFAKLLIKTQKFLGVIYFILGVAFIFIAGEEIS